MSHHPRPALPSHVRAASTSHSQQTTSHNSSSTGGASPLLLQRIADKTAELASLKQLQALSGGVAGQMQALEDKLATLADGTEAVAAVLSNWHNVLRAVHMASTKLPVPKTTGDGGGGEDVEEKVPLPVTLVRIPTEQAGLIPHATSGASAD